MTTSSLKETVTDAAQEQNSSCKHGRTQLCTGMLVFGVARDGSSVFGVWQGRVGRWRGAGWGSMLQKSKQVGN
jgi:hypothetical protein